MFVRYRCVDAITSPNDCPDLVVRASPFLSSPWANRLRSLIASAQTDLLICSPFISVAGAKFLRGHATPTFRLDGRLKLITDLSPVNIYQASTDPAAVLLAVDSFAPTSIHHLPRLHAKVYVADVTVAIITSANFTGGGLYRNHEYGIEITDRESVERIRSDLVDYSRLGAVIPRESLVRLCGYASKLRDSETKARKTIPTALSNDLHECLQGAEDELLRLRLAGALHAVFAETIRYLLDKNGPLSTTELHPLIQAIHPDLCDDQVDRVIDGRRYGKKWKHAVRTAQQQLKRQGIISLNGRIWRLTGSAKLGSIIGDGNGNL